MVALDKQRPDIAQGVNENSQQGKDIGAGDQGLMFGYAFNDTAELMPMPIALAHRILNRITEVRRTGRSTGSGPTARARSRSSTRAARLADRHRGRLDPARPDVEREIRDVIKKIIMPVCRADWSTGDIKYYINPTGRFVVGGPHGDCGLTGRKIIVDTYGGWAGTAAARSAARTPPRSTARRLHGPVRRQERRRLGTGRALRGPARLRHRRLRAGERPRRHLRDRQACRRADRESSAKFPLNPTGIIKYLDLRRPIYRKTASGGHFGRSEPEFTWEKTHRVADLQAAAGKAGKK